MPSQEIEVLERATDMQELCFEWSHLPLQRENNQVTIDKSRLQGLESIVSQLLPGVSIDDLLNSPDPVQASGLTPGPSTPGVLQSTAISTPRSDSGTAVSNDPVLPEAVPSNADGFNWQEEDANLDSLTDGMAALSVEPTGVGYLGSTSGVVFLRCLLDWAGFLHQSQAQPQERRTERSALLTGVLASSHVSHAALTNQIASTLIDAYFQGYHCVYPFVHEATFRAQFHEIVPRPTQRSWDMLYHAILALGAWCLNKDQVGLEDYLYRRALTLGQHESVFEKADLTSVQALVLLSNLSQKRNAPNTGWNLLGLAVRNALSIALHRELPHWNISLMEREIRRRVWWGVYIFDSGASTTFGRAVMLPDQDSMNVHPVLNISDEALTPQTTELPPESTEPTLYSALKTQSDLHIHTNHISNRLLADPGLSAEAALSISVSMDTWSQTMPSYFGMDHQSNCQHRWYTFARSRSWWRFWNLKIIVFRHILLRHAISERGQIPDPAAQAKQEECTRLCIEAANATVTSIHQYAVQGLTRLEGWYATYFLFHAALVMSLCIISFPQSTELPVWHQAVRLARSTFRDHLVEDSLSARCVAILDQVVTIDDIDAGIFQDAPQLDRDALSNFPWSVESNELFNSFDWDLTSNAF
ncbi:lactose regulatory protein lac9 and GAL4-like protein [Curvularia kusanoi]|uniref:Lactose regulatory protein lac9 and GAL4-like protein n=1 Tax=Curvularia kusanoi TaxID=90978 RepID=A0A9P4W7J2_CURKU|nr:lactose regulatory protein lac9 and GAL4-like protein [Curvularia kusanoi]